ncbi:MAG: diacylglycerol kinase family protein [Patescibacteria group bacterium]
MFNIHYFIKSLGFALNGLAYVWKSEQSFRFQVLIAIVIILGGFFFKLSLIEFSLLTLLIIFVLAAEILNTVMEKLLDIVHPNWSPAVKIVKDISAAIVLVFSFGALIVGILLFTPHIIQ